MIRQWISSYFSVETVKHSLTSHGSRDTAVSLHKCDAQVNLVSHDPAPYSAAPLSA